MITAYDHLDPHWLDRAVFPFRSRWWKAPQGTMHYIDEGEGAPVVFVHGVPGWSFHFRSLIRRVSAYRRCIAMDHLGFGLSEKPEGWDYDPAHLAANVEAMIDGLGLEGVTLVVHDWGGPLGLRYAVKRPENVEGIVVMNSWFWSAKGDLRTRATTRVLATSFYRWVDAGFAVTARVFPRAVTGRDGGLSATARTHFAGPFRDPRDRSGLLALVRHTHLADDWVGGQGDPKEALRDVPALVVWGTDDPAFPRRYLERWRAELPHARCVALDGVGHYPFEESPRATGEAIDEFLRSEPLK
jgi:haloalkane dehalogenase